MYINFHNHHNTLNNYYGTYCMYNRYSISRQDKHLDIFRRYAQQY